MHSRKIIAGLAALVMLGTLGCASSRKKAWEREDAKVTAQGSAQADPNELARAEEAWKKRDDKAQLQAALDIWTKIASSGAGNYAIYAKLSRGFYLMGDGYVDDADVNKKLEYFDQGATWGEKALYTFPAFKEVVDIGKPVEEAVTRLGKEAIDGIYWNAVNVGKWAKTKGTSTILFYKSRVKKTIEHLITLDEKYFYGAPHRYLGAYYAAAPGFSGGDLGKSKEHFDKAIKIEPNYFGTRVLYAVEYAVKDQDAALYKKELEFVINGKPEVLPDVAPEQKIEQQKAKKALPQVEDLF